MTSRRVEHHMGTVVSITTRGAVDPGVVDQAFAEVRRIERSFSTFLEDSHISRIQRGELPIERAPIEVREVLAACDGLVEGTGGRFQHRPGGWGLDPSAYVKGWAGDIVGKILAAGGCREYSINMGGDVLSSGGTEQQPWAIGIQHPSEPDSIAAVLPIGTAAVATSGSYERGDHIRGADGSLRSVTVIGPELAIADALSTAMFSGGIGDLRWMTGYPGYEALFITRDRVHWSEGLEGLLAGAIQVG
ncbi:MAG: FAD:protein FMN transferase [Acidimicrobiia bacterium]